MNRELRLLTPYNLVDGEEIPDRKFFTFRYGSTDNPYGKGLGQRLWWPVWFKKHGIKYWVIFSEKFGAPTVMGKYPQGTDQTKQDELLAALDAVQQEAGIILPEGFDLSFLEAMRTSTVSTHKELVEYMNRQISKVVLGQTLTTELGNKGSFAASKTHDNVRDDIVRADANLQAELFNNEPIKWIIDYNFPGVTVYPKLVIRTEKEKDLKPQAERDKIIIKDVGLPVTEQYLYDTYKIPKPQDGEELLAPPSPVSAPALPFSEWVSPREFISTRGTTFKWTEENGWEEFAEKKNPEVLGLTSQRKVDRTVVRFVKSGKSIFNKLIKKMISEIKKSDSFSDMLVRLDEINTSSTTKKLSESLAQAQVSTDKIGVESIRAEIEPADNISFSEYEETRWGPGFPFDQAIDFFRDKSFELAGIAVDDLLDQIKREIDTSLVEGTTLKDFQKSASSIFKKLGYVGVTPWRTETIYRTNMQGAYQAGRYNQMTDQAVLIARPFWATRLTHAAMHGRIFRNDHPIWAEWYPPNGFNCRCYVMTVSARQVAANNWNVETVNVTGKSIPSFNPTTGLPDKGPDIRIVPDPGWDKLPIAA
jgi:SPP1 gp7 family putative phage head morphogenesis protein